MSERCSLFLHHMAVQAFLLLRVALNPYMKTLLVSLEVAAKEAAVTVPRKHCAATLTGCAVVVALPPEMLTPVHVRGDYSSIAPSMTLSIALLILACQQNGQYPPAIRR